MKRILLLLTSVLVCSHTFADVPEGNITFEDPAVKAICVANWDTNSDGELSYAEAAAVTSIFGFSNNKSITSFDEFQYFTGVTSIGDDAFDGCSRLTSINIPDGVTSIGEDAFSDCSSLTSINIPEGVTSIGGGAFSDCSSLTSITIPDGVTSIGGNAFYSCEALTSITIPNSVTSIGNRAFGYCSSLASITIPNSVTSIGDAAFGCCSSLASIKVESDNEVYDSRNDCNAIIKTETNELITGCKNTIIPNSATSIMNNAFNGCSGLTSIIIPNSVTSIGSNVFTNCSGLTSIKVESGNGVYDSRNNCNAIIKTETSELIAGCKNTTIPNSVTSIGERAFYGRSGLTSITLPNSVTSIGSNAFWGCSGLTSITIPNSVTSIGNWAFGDCSSLTSITIPNSLTSIGTQMFYYCSSLTSITIPNSVTSIGYDAFDHCPGLASVVVENPTPVAISQNVFSNRANATLYVPAGSKAAYEAADYWKEFKEIYTIKSNGDTFTASVPCGNGTINLTFKISEFNPNKVQVSASPASLSGKLIIPATVQDNESCTFAVTGIGAEAFMEQAGLTEVMLPEGLTTIGNKAFEGTGLSTISLPSTLTSIGQEAFRMSDLSTIVIPDGVTSIGVSAFRECFNLQSVSLGSGVTSIGSAAFYDCAELTSVNVRMSTPVAITSNVFSNRRNAILYVPIFSKEAYETANYWKEFKEIVQPIDELSELSNAKLYTLTNATGMLKVMGNTLTTSEGCLDPDHMGLVTSVSQLSSPSTDSYEGSLDALLDNNTTTFWHSNWHDGSVANHSHYLQVELTESVNEDICLQMTRRNTPGNHIIQWGVYGSNSATAADGDWEELVSISMPYGSNIETCLSDPFDTKGYKYLRFYIDGTTSNNGYGHLSEFRLFTASDIAAYRGSSDKENCKFALLNINNKYYLYSPTKRAFYLAQDAFCPGFGSVITISDNNASGDYRWTLTMPLNGETKSLCQSNSPYKIMPVEDFDPTEALAAFTENVDLGLTDGYYRIHSSDLYACGSIDEDGTLYGSWKKMADPGTDRPSLWKLTKREGGYDLQNMHTQSHFTGAYTNKGWIMSTDGDALFAFDRVTQVNGHDVFNIRLTTQDMGDFNYIHQPWGESGPLGKWCNTGTGGGTEWVLEPVSDEEATAITSIAVGNTFAAAVPCGEGTADLTFKVTNCNPWEVEVSASPEDIAGALTIPATVQNESGIEFAVKAVAEWAFSGRNSLTSVTIPASITGIGGSAFGWSTGLTSVTFLGDIERVCPHTFQGCTGLANVTFQNITEINEEAFRDCHSLKSITLPEGLTQINSHAFRSSGLESIKFPSTLTSVGIAAFRDCQALKTIDFNNCTATLEAEAFLGTAIEELVIPENITLNGWTHFGWCSQLRSVELKNTNQSATNDAFKVCLNLESAILPKADIMAWGWFIDCLNLQSITFRNGDAGGTPYFRNFINTPDDVLYTVPEGTAESFLKKGYRNLSDKSGLPLVREEFEAETARIAAMAEALDDGDKTALNTAIADARTTVNATDDYLTIYAQITAIKTAAKTYLTTATLPAEFNVTAAAITNPDIDRFHLGWTLGWAASGGYKTEEFTNGDVTIDNFVESWPDSDGNIISQIITSLPAGIYRLEADLIATIQNNAETAVTGVSLFAGSKSIAVATENQKPQHFSVKFENTLTKDVTIGIIINGTNANWVAMDNVRLIYEGKAADIPQGVDLASDENARVYLYNVETGKYLSAGHSHGTHAMLDETGLPVRLTQNAETGLWQIYFWEGSRNDQLLFSHYSSEKREEVYVDYDHSRSDADEDLTLWSITQAGDGSYLIQNKKYLDSEFYLGNIPTRQDAQNEYNGVSYTDIISKASVNDNSHWLIFTKENSDQLSAKHLLMAAIMRMEASDNVNDELLAAARAIYNNVDATAAEVIGITTQLNSQMGMPALNQPVDMTDLIINPRFENNTTEGWSGANVVGGRSDATSNHEQEFYEKDFNMYQTITGVPNGIYRLKWKGFHRPGSCDQVYNEYNAGTDNASAVVYANNTQKTMLNWATGSGDADLGDWQANGVSYPNTMEAARKHFDAGLYADFLEVEVTDNVLTIGVKNTEPMASKHWVIFSDFELYIMENAEQAHNKLAANDLRSVPGRILNLPINLKNNKEIASGTCKITLPDGVRPVLDDRGNIKIKTTSRVPAAMDISGTLSNDGICRFAFMPSSQAIAPGEGTIFSIQIQTEKEMELGNYNISIHDVKLVTTDLLSIKPFSANNTLTLREPDPESGDVNGDGITDILDATYIVYHLLDRSLDFYYETAGDVNQDHETDILDATIIVYRLLGRIKAPARKTDILDPQ